MDPNNPVNPNPPAIVREDEQELWNRVNGNLARIAQTEKGNLEIAFETGDLLIALKKKRMPGDQWKAKMQAKIKGSVRRAQEFMFIAKHIKKTRRSAFLSVSQALADCRKRRKEAKEKAEAAQQERPVSGSKNNHSAAAQNEQAILPFPGAPATEETTAQEPEPKPAEKLAAQSSGSTSQDQSTTTLATDNTNGTVPDTKPEADVETSHALTWDLESAPVGLAADDRETSLSLVEGLDDIRKRLIERWAVLDQLHPLNRLAQRMSYIVSAMKQLLRRTSQDTDEPSEESET